MFLQQGIAVGLRVAIGRKPVAVAKIVERTSLTELQLDRSAAPVEQQPADQRRQTAIEALPLAADDRRDVRSRPVGHEGRRELDVARQMAVPEEAGRDDVGASEGNQPGQHRDHEAAQAGDSPDAHKRQP